MRPKKEILLVCNGPDTGVRRFVLETRGYRVLTASCATSALAILRRRWVDAALIELAKPRPDAIDGIELARRLKDSYPEVFAILFSDRAKKLSRPSCADAFLRAGHTAAEMLDQVYVLTRRKRGPKAETAAAEAVA